VARATAQARSCGEAHPAPLLGAQVFAFAVALLILSGTLFYEADHGGQFFFGLNAWLVSLRQSPAFRLDTLLPFAAGQPSVSLVYLAPGAAMLFAAGRSGGLPGD